MFNSLQPQGLCSPWNSPGQNTAVSSLSLGDLSNPGIESMSPALQADSLPADPQVKPTNIGVSSRSLLQGIFRTQESNQSFLHCGQILYQLSYEESPLKKKVRLKLFELFYRIHFKYISPNNILTESIIKLKTKFTIVTRALALISYCNWYHQLCVCCTRKVLLSF